MLKYVDSYVLAFSKIFIDKILQVRKYSVGDVIFEKFNISETKKSYTNCLIFVL